MERKRVAGRFVAEDKGGVAKKRAATTSQPKQESVQPAEVVVKLGGLDQNDLAEKPKTRTRKLVSLLLKSLKKLPGGSSGA
jgi:hypothetical protein